MKKNIRKTIDFFIFSFEQLNVILFVYAIREVLLDWNTFTAKHNGNDFVLNNILSYFLVIAMLHYVIFRIEWLEINLLDHSTFSFSPFKNKLKDLSKVCCYSLTFSLQFSDLIICLMTMLVFPVGIFPSILCHIL